MRTRKYEITWTIPFTQSNSNKASVALKLGADRVLYNADDGIKIIANCDIRFGTREDFLLAISEEADRLGLKATEIENTQYKIF